MSIRDVGPHPSAYDRMDALFAVTVLFALALRHGDSEEPPLPPGFDGERQLAELHALTAACTHLRSPR